MAEKPVISKKEMSKFGDRFWQRVHYDKKFREGVKEDFEKLQKIALKGLDLSSETTTVKEAKDKILLELMLDVADKYLKAVEESENNDKFKEQNGTFILLKKGKKFIFNTSVLRDNKIRKGYLIFNSGLPKLTGKKTLFIKKPINLAGFEKIDSGKYHFRQKGYRFGYFHFKGKKDKYFLKFYNCKMLDKSQKSFEMIFKRDTKYS